MKNMGSDITAVFPEKTDGAVQSAVGIISLIGEINAGQEEMACGKPDIRISLYKGNAMLGTIGEEKRMECTMILDDGNILQYICKLTARLGVSVLAAESVMRALENKDRCLYRYMGKVRFENAAGPIRIYDVFQGDRESVRKLRTETKESFEEGIRLYETGRYLEARSRFIGVLRRDREDGAAKGRSGPGDLTDVRKR